MNREQLEIIKQQNLKKLDIESFRPNINVVSFNPFSESIIHFLVKSFLCYQIRRGVPLEILKKSSDNENLLVTLMDNPRKFYPYYEKFHHQFEMVELVTEARFKNGRIGDIYILKCPHKSNCGNIGEVESNRKISKGGEETVTFYI